MKKVFMFLVLASSLVACKNDAKQIEETKSEVAAPTLDALKADVKVMDDSVKALYAEMMAGDRTELPRYEIHELINRNIKLYKAYPKAKEVPEALNQVQQMYGQLRVEPEARRWRDTLINAYKDYEGRALVIQMQASSYDDMETYEPEMITKYYKMLLNDYPDLDAELKATIEDRLAHIHLNFMQLIEKRISEN